MLRITVNLKFHTQKKYHSKWWENKGIFQTRLRDFPILRPLIKGLPKLSYNSGKKTDMRGKSEQTEKRDNECKQSLLVTDNNEHYNNAD